MNSSSPNQMSPGSVGKHFKTEVSENVSINSHSHLEHILHLSSPEQASRVDYHGGSHGDRSPKRRRTWSADLSESTMTSKGKDPPKQDFGPAVMTVEGATKTIDPVVQNYQKDPYALDPDLTLRYVNMYFTHVNQTTYCMSAASPQCLVSVHFR